jgi:hypothetical protein
MPSASPVTVARFPLRRGALTFWFADRSHFDGDHGGQADAYQGYESDGTQFTTLTKNAGLVEQ